VKKQVSVQLPTSADNVALPAFAAARRAAARLLLTAGPPAVQQSIHVSCQPGPQQQTGITGVRWIGQTYKRTDRQTDRRTDRYNASSANKGVSLSQGRTTR